MSEFGLGEKNPIGHCKLLGFCPLKKMGISITISPNCVGASQRLVLERQKPIKQLGCFHDQVSNNLLHIIIIIIITLFAKSTHT